MLPWLDRLEQRAVTSLTKLGVIPLQLLTTTAIAIGVFAACFEGFKQGRPCTATFFGKGGRRIKVSAELQGFVTVPWEHIDGAGNYNHIDFYFLVFCSFPGNRIECSAPQTEL